jgi:hypothetical protein
MDLALAQLALIFLPGIIWASIDARYGVGLRPNQFALMLKSFLFGVATHTVLFLLYTALGYNYGYAEILNNNQGAGLINFMDEIAISIPLSVAMSIIWLYLITYRIFMKLLHYINATKRYGDEDVWSFTLNSNQPHVEYVHLRDIKNGFIFAGWVNTYSENEPIREILLRDAIVYNDQGEKISEAPHLYIAGHPQEPVRMGALLRRAGQ